LKKKYHGVVYNKLSKGAKYIHSHYKTSLTKGHPSYPIRLLRTIVVLTQTLKSLPDDVMMTMKLLYFDDGKIEETRF
jgi:hypothetical protein